MKNTHHMEFLMNRNLKIAALISGAIFSCSFTEAYANAGIKPLESVNVTVIQKKATLNQLFSSIEAQSDFMFVYNDTDVSDIEVSVDFKNKSIEDVLNETLKGTSLTYAVDGKTINIIKQTNKTYANVQNEIVVKGLVKDTKGEPIIGANIIITGSTVGTITDVDGKFQLEAPKNAQIRISFIGYKTQTVTIRSGRVMNIVLEEDKEALDEVVVTALGIKRSEKALGYATQKVTGDKLTTVKNVEIASNLVGKVAGLNVYSSTEFNRAPSISLRGESPLLVVDGVPTTNITLREIASDDVESMNILKGATASALYGSRGSSGAIIITTKKGNKKGGLQVNVSNNTMFEAGYLAFPDTQHAYSSGGSGQYRVGDYVWGAPLDQGVMAKQYNPHTYEWEERELTSVGKNNFKNFLGTGVVTNSNINLSYQGDKGSFRTSFTHVFNKGQYPNAKLNKFTYSLGGDFKVGKFSFEGNFTYNKRIYPNDRGTGYGSGGYIYNLVIWSGAEYDLMQYKDYWMKGQEGVMQNWQEHQWYDNPYFLANEVVHNDDFDVTNGSLAMNYEILPWLNLKVRSGFEYYANREERKYSKSYSMQKNGYYYLDQSSAFSMNHDVLLNGNYKFGKFGIDGLLGGTINYMKGSNIWGETNNGLSIPGYFSLKGSVDPAKVGQGGYKKQVNSLFGKLSLSWDSMLFIDITGRNDWSSTLPSSTRSYFYPSVAGSFILSEVIDMPSWISLVKLRGSWTKNKNDLGIYEINNNYSISTNLWDGKTAAYFPSTIRGVDLLPESSRSYEFGFNLNFLKNRIWTDFTYYNKRNMDFAVRAPLSQASGYNTTYINSKEERERRGFEVSVGATPIKTKDFEWNTLFNWSSERYVFAKLDPQYTSKAPWIKKGGRCDYLTTPLWDTDSEGNLVHGASGLPLSLPYHGLMGYSNPDWIWGFNNTLRYKNFTFSFSFDGCVGGTSYNWTDQIMWCSGSHIKSDNQWRRDEVVNKNISFVGPGVKVVSGTIERDEWGQVIKDNRVYAPNDVKVSYENYIREYNNDYYQGKPQEYKDRTYIKLREVALNYTLPKSLSQKLKMNELTIGVTGNNLLLWAKSFKYADPDGGSDNINSPSMRYIGFNIKTSF